MKNKSGTLNALMRLSSAVTRDPGWEKAGNWGTIRLQRLERHRLFGRCGEGRLGLKRAPGTFPSALGFESLQTIRIAALQRSAAILGIGSNG